MKTLILFRGLPAVGKSHFARLLSQELQTPIVDRDKIKSEVIKQYATPADPYCRDPKFRQLATNLTLSKADENFQSGNRVILDSFIPSLPNIKLLDEKFPPAQYRRIVIKVLNRDKNLWRKRFDNRERLPNQARDDFEEAISFKSDNREMEPDIEVDSSQPDDQNLQRILDFLSRSPEFQELLFGK